MKGKTQTFIVRALGGTAAIAVVCVAILTSSRVSQEYSVPQEVVARPQAPDSMPAPTSAEPRKTTSQEINNEKTGSTNEFAAPTANSPSTAASESEAQPILSFSTQWNDPDQPSEFTRFASWVERYRNARSPEERMALTAEGVTLAQERQEAMKDRMRRNPESALQLAVPYAVQEALPDDITVLLEKTVSERGTLAVFAALAEPGKEHEVTPVWRTATLGGQEYDAFVYGRRLGEPTRRDIPLNGIVLGQIVALSAHPVRVLDVDEAAARAPAPADPLCAVSGQSVALQPTPTVAEVGGRKVRLCGLGHASDLNTRLIRAEATGSDESSQNGAGSDGVQASNYTEGVKRLLIIRVDFSDLPGDPLTMTEGVNLVSGLNDFYRESSYARTSFELVGSGSGVTPTLRMPYTAEYYGVNNLYSLLQDDARDAAAAMGYDVDDYNFDLTCFGSIPGWNWAGLGWVGAPGVWLRNYFTVGVAAHELGHNLGLNHANYWDTEGKSVIGAGESIEYGDVYDTMGSAGSGANHFNARYKSYLNWLTAAAVQTVTTSGVYRIQAHDDANATGLRALKIARNSQTNYWVEFRQKFPANNWMMNGAGIRWAGLGNQRSDLLDTTPGSANGKNDSALVVGRTFSDVAANVHITTLRKAGTTPESLDVAVYVGSFPTNEPPTVSVGANLTSVAAGATVTLTATASDPNGDTLAYAWDFGDGTFGSNSVTVTKSWNLTSEFRVQCTVTDMRGGTSRDSIVVTVGSPPTHRISGVVSAGGVGVPGARVYTSSSRMTYTDSDGGYTLAGLPAGSYTVNVSLDPYTFTPLGFANPVAIGPSATSVHFTAAGISNPPYITRQPRHTVVTAGDSASLSVNVTGTGPFGYQWHCGPTRVPSGTGAVLTLTNVQAAQAGAYSVVVTNATGATTSLVAILSVLAPTSGTITLRVNGHGLVKGATNGQRLLVGKAYKLSVVPASGYVFSNWTGALPRHSPVLSFVMESNLLVTANFVPNPFAAFKGTFNGLFHGTNEVLSQRAGFFTLALNAKGSYTASLLTRGWKLKAKGALDLNGRGTNLITTPEGQTYTLNWAVALDGSEQINGTVSAGAWTSPLLGDRLVYHPSTNAASQAGRYTAILPGDPEQTSAPGGDSYGLVTVNTKGIARLSAYLADNARFVMASSISREGHWPVYATVVGAGTILGWLNFRDQAATDFDGLLNWNRPANAGTAYYPAAFSSETAMLGSRVPSMAPGESLIDWSNPTVRFSGGQLIGPYTNSLAVTGPAILNLSSNALTLKISPSSGLFTGTLKVPGASKPLPFRGVVLPKAGMGGGYFLGTNTSGQVRIE